MKKIFIALFIAVFAALYIIAYVLPNISDVFVKSYTAEYGTIDVDEEIDYLIVRNEKVYTSDESGQVKKEKEAGELVRRTTRIVSVGGQGYFSKDRGIVSYTYDGLEKKFTPKKLEKITQKDIYPKTDENGKSTYKLKKCENGSANVGSKIFKIIDNKEWYIVSFLDKEDAETLTLGSSVKIEFGDEKILPCKVFFIEGQDEKEVSIATAINSDAQSDKKIEVIFSCDRYLENLDSYRYGTARLIKYSKTGIILETNSIVEEDGYKGVYVLNKYDDYVFTKISVIDEIGDKTVVEMNTFYDKKSDKVLYTVKNYDTVLKQKEGKNDVDKE